MTLKDVPVDEITRVIGLATAPAFLLGAVAGLLSLLVSRLTRVGDLVRGLVARRNSDDEPWKRVALKDALRRVWHTRWAITLCVNSGIVTGWMVVLVFVDALFGFQNSRAIAIAFIAAMVLFTTALIFLLLGRSDDLTSSGWDQLGLGEMADAGVWPCHRMSMRFGTINGNV